MEAPKRGKRKRLPNLMIVMWTGRLKTNALHEPQVVMTGHFWQVGWGKIALRVTLGMILRERNRPGVALSFVLCFGAERLSRQPWPVRREPAASWNRALEVPAFQFQPTEEVSYLNDAEVMRPRAKPFTTDGVWEFPAASVSALEIQTGSI